MNEYSIAPIYDIMLYPFVRSVRKAILDLSREYGYESILDVCCGTGDQLKLLRRHGFQAEGVDLSEDMLEVSKKGSYAASCRYEDASRMSYGDDSFDAVMTTFALHEKEPELAQAILEEMTRVVKPQGHIVIADYRFDEQTASSSRAIITTIERFAGGEHYLNFCRYIEDGGITALLDGFPLTPLTRKRVGLGSVGIECYRLNT